MIRLYGSGDDILIIEGDMSAEFYAEEETHYLAFSDGTLVFMNFVDGIWRIRVHTEADFQVEKASMHEDIASDTVEIDISPDWVVFGNKCERAS